jgi:Zn-dependent M28 family amino/carboxypeptidase
MVEGTDPVLRNTYLFIGAHLDHVGYVDEADEAPHGRVNVPVTQDPIWNGADDDGSGSTAVLAMAKAFVRGPKPKRSVVFVWHAGEEAGLLGSSYMADHPVVPLEQIQAELNIDMIGRNRDDNPAQIDTVYVIGADRISTDLHNLLVETNRRSARPLTLDYEFNDPADPNSFYTRSDHYSYASKGIPIAFFFTGEHPDYHANTDSVDKILFPKLVRIAQFIYQAGFAIADSDRVLERDNLGPRAGKGFSGGLLPRKAGS